MLLEVFKLPSTARLCPQSDYTLLKSEYFTYIAMLHISVIVKKRTQRRVIPSMMPLKISFTVGA